MGFEKEITEEGTGAEIEAGQQVTVHCTGFVVGGPSKHFWSTKDTDTPFQFQVGVGQVIKAWDEGVLTMTVGEKATITATPDYAYGEAGFPAWGIPENAVLAFDIEVLSAM